MSHPLDLFHYCPVCGSAEFHISNAKARHCAACGFTYYANPSSATAAFIVNNRGELLVATRGKEPARGTLDLPGGFCDMDETVEQGMAREVEEETGCRPVQMRYLFSLPNRYEYSGMVIHTMDMFFECRLATDAVPRAADDVASLRWMPISEVRPELFGLHSISRGVAKYLSQLAG